MLIEALDSFQYAKREHGENKKAQHVKQKGQNNEVTYFRASGLGDADRKLLYKFFAHNFPTIPRTAKNLRQLENGDYVHDRYQNAWRDMGALISMEQRISSKDDDFLGQFEWELAGHYDGLLDINILRAHALGLATVHSVKNEETGEWGIEVDIDEAYAKEIGLYDAEGYIAEDYEPLPMVADIKTMNPWSFKKIKDKADVSDIDGYILQIMTYMYLLNTPYGSIFIESKDNNDVLEVQVLWRDLHNSEEDPYLYEWHENIHGAPSTEKVRVMVESSKFFGSETEEGLVPRLDRLWYLREVAIRMDSGEEVEGVEQLADVFPEPCAAEPDKFPCSWGHKTGTPSYCEFFDHCHNQATKGVGIRPGGAVPDEFIWEVVDTETGEVCKVDNRKVPEGVTEDAFKALVQMQVLELQTFIVKEPISLRHIVTDEQKAEETAFNADNLFTATGELILVPQVGEVGTEAAEYKTEDGKTAIDCLNCGKQNTYARLGNGGTKKCTHCKHVNKVNKLQK